MQRRIVLAASFLGFTGIILGAFGAHALKKVLSAEMLAVFETGVKYQMYHALFLLLLSFINVSEKARKGIFYLVLAGVVFFSGSIYLLATDAVNNFDFKRFGIVTPIGGFLLIMAWGWLFLDFMRKKS